MKVELKEANYLIQYPTNWKPTTKDQCLSALVGYNLGDGTITKKSDNKYSSAFYGDYESLLEISDCFETAYNKDVNVRFKKGSRKEFNSFQIQIAGPIAIDLINKGCIVGKKTEVDFGVPLWIMEHEDLQVRRAFIAALWGAEGSSPLQQHRTMRMPVLTMHKREYIKNNTLFNDLVSIMKELNISVVLKNRKSSTGIASSLYVNSGIENYIAFLDNCGFIFAVLKTDKAWLWSNYLKAMKYDATNREDIAREAYNKNNKCYAEAARYLNVSKGYLWKLLNRDSNAVQPDRNFDKFEQWVSNRIYNGGLKLNIKKKVETTKKVQMYNILVSSKDHSYLLANGINNFNSFETATGKVYDDYSKLNHTDKVYDDNRHIIWTHDFNYTPMSSAIIQEYGEQSFVVDEIILESAVAKNAALEFIERFKNSKIKEVHLYGDAAGRAGEKHSQASSWSVIKQILKDNGWRVIDRVPLANQSIMDGQNHLRARILNALDEVNLFVNPSICKYTDKGLATTQLKDGSSFQEKDSNYQHITTALRYYAKIRFPIVSNIAVQRNYTRY